MSTLHNSTKNREALLKEIFKSLAEALDLRHPDGQLIEATFEPMNDGYIGWADPSRDNVILSNDLLRPNVNARSAISVFLHECAHKLTVGHAHDFVFFTLNLALHFRAGDFLLDSPAGDLYQQLLNRAGHNRRPLWLNVKLYDAQNTTLWPWDVVGSWLGEGVRLARRVYQTNLTPTEIANLARETAQNLRLDIIKSTAPRSWRAELWRMTPRDWIMACITSASVGGAAVAGAGIAILITH